jgi:hypothetical protein
LPAFLVALAKNFANAAITIGWFHVVQLFTTAVDQARLASGRDLSEDQRSALAKLDSVGDAIATGCHTKEMRRWTRQVNSAQAALW